MCTHIISTHTSPGPVEGWVPKRCSAASCVAWDQAGPDPQVLILRIQKPFSFLDWNLASFCIAERMPFLLEKVRYVFQVLHSPHWTREPFSLPSLPGLLSCLYHRVGQSLTLIEKQTQREYSNYKDDALVATKKEQGNPKEITHLLINHKYSHGTVTVH